MDNDPKNEIKKSLEQMFPPELAKSLAKIELDPEDILKSDEVYGLIKDNSNKFANIVIKYFEEHPIEMVSHMIASLNNKESKSDNISKLNENKYIIPFYLFLLCHFKETSRVTLDKFKDVDKMQQRAAEWIYQAQQMAAISKIKSFEGRARNLMQKADKLIELFLKEMLIDISDILGMQESQKKTLGQLKDDLIKSGKATIISFIFSEDIYNLRIASAHKYEIDYSQEKIKLFKWGKSIREITVDEGMKILSKCLMICAAYHQAISMIYPKIAIKEMGNV